MGFVDRIRSLVGGGAGSSMSVDRPTATSEYFRRDSSPFLQSWQPALREHAADVRASYDIAAARAVDAIHNSGFIAGIMETSTAAVVGTGLKLAARPDGAAVGWNPKQAADWAKLVEARWNAWCACEPDCDAAGKMTFGQMQGVAYASWMAYGEVLALNPVFQRRRDVSSPATKVLMLPPTRLMHKTDGVTIWDGVEIDQLGFPIGYWLMERVPELSGMSMRERRVDAYDRRGRRNITHIMNPGPAITRGISPLAPALKVVRQLEQYCDATLTAALLQTIFAATIKTNATGAAAFEGLMTSDEQLDLGALAAAKDEWYSSAKVDLFTHGRIAHLFPNDELEFKKAEHPGQQFDQVMGWLGREICRVAGVTYENGMGDYRTATYSSVRMATAETWKIVEMRRENVISPLCQRTYETFLEDEIGMGHIPLPGGLATFRANRDALCRARWTGPPKPQADDLKTANAYTTLYDLGATSLQEICAEYGLDWQIVMEQRAEERAYAISMGLPDPYIQVLAEAAAAKAGGGATTKQKSDSGAANSG
jgi:lambda family phage portal protein